MDSDQVTNTHKSQILTFDFTPSQFTKARFKIKRKAEAVMYLGVNIPQKP